MMKFAREILGLLLIAALVTAAWATDGELQVAQLRVLADGTG